MACTAQHSTARLHSSRVQRWVLLVVSTVQSRLRPRDENFVVEGSSILDHQSTFIPLLSSGPESGCAPAPFLLCCAVPCCAIPRPDLARSLTHHFDYSTTWRIKKLALSFDTIYPKPKQLLTESNTMYIQGNRNSVQYHLRTQIITPECGISVYIRNSALSNFTFRSHPISSPWPIDPLLFSYYTFTNDNDNQQNGEPSSKTIDGITSQSSLDRW